MTSDPFAPTYTGPDDVPSDWEDDIYMEDDDTPDSSPDCGPLHDVVTVQSDCKSLKDKGLLTSYWKVATGDEKQEMISRGFQQLRDRHEENMGENAHQKRLKKSRERALARERQQKHRDRSRERKIANNWIPGQKRVCFTHINITLLLIINKETCVIP